MIHYLPNNAETESQLHGALEIIRDPENWCKGYMQDGDAYCLNGALYAAGMADNPVNFKIARRRAVLVSREFIGPGSLDVGFDLGLYLDPRPPGSGWLVAERSGNTKRLR